MTLLVATFIGVGLLLIALAVPLIRRTVPPNRWYGLRVAATFADEWVWYEANARSGRDLLVLGAALIVTASSLAAFGVREDVYAIANLAVLLAGTIAFAAIGIGRANRLLRVRRASGGAA